MFCALFKDHLLLAASRSGGFTFEIVAIINLNDVQVDKADNGKGGSPLFQSKLCPQLSSFRSSMSHSAFLVETRI